MSFVVVMGGQELAVGHPVDRLSAARLAFRTGVTGKGLEDATKHFTAQFMQRLGRRLSSEQIATIVKAEHARQHGLASCRAGDNDAATLFLAHAEALCDEAALSRHARLAALSFQLAAQAYVHYRRRNRAEAISALESAIVTACELEAIYGHDMEFQRVHLARNILRVRASTPTDRTVLSDIVGLLHYIGGDRSRWPLPTGQNLGNPTKLSGFQSSWAIDELLLNLALPAIDIGSARELLPSFIKAEGLSQTKNWCRAISSLRAGELQQAIADATLFFEEGGGRLVQAGQYLDSLLDQVGIQIDG